LIFAQAKPAPKAPPPAPPPAPTPAIAEDPLADKGSQAMFFITLLEVEMAAKLCAMSPDHETCKGRNPSAELVDLYGKGMKSPEVSRALIAKTVRSYAEMREGARSAPQVSQAVDEASIKMQMIVIAQNQRIIELLEQLVRKKP
jgi:hypothetical protein